MNKIKNRYIAIFALVAGTTGLLQADEGSNEWSPKVSTTVYQQDYRNSSPLSFVEPSDQYYFSADVLVWKPQISGLDLDFAKAYITQVTTTDLQTTDTYEFDSDPHFKWNAGYRLALGYESACDNWGLEAVWTSYQGSGSRDNQEDVSTVNSGKWRVNLGQVDVAAAYNVNLNESFTLKPFLGLRGARIHQKLNALLVTDISLTPAGPGTETRTLDDHQNFLGLGPLFGFKGDWNVGCGFDLFGTASASILYGTYKVTFDDTDIFSAPVSKQFYSVDKKHLDGFDLNLDFVIGVSWETRLCDLVDLTMKLGLEHHQYYNQGRLGSNYGDLSFDGGFFSLVFAL